MRRLLIVAIIVVGTVGAFAIYTFGWRDDGSDRKNPQRSRTLAGTHVYVGHQGDVFKVPATATRCVVSQEGGFTNIVCTHMPRGRHQVYFYKDRIQVWRSGKPGQGPIFSARP